MLSAEGGEGMPIKKVVSDLAGAVVIDPARIKAAPIMVYLNCISHLRLRLSCTKQRRSVVISPSRKVAATM
jgi:hypothetical protein